MNLNVISEMNRQAKSDVKVSANLMDTAKLSQEAKNAVGNRPVFDLKATYNNGANSITSFGNGIVSVEIPYTKQAYENEGNLYAVYVDNNGKAQYLLNSSYDANRQCLMFKTNHFSVYGVGYINTPGFTDIANHWAKNDIQYAVSRGLIQGASSTVFAPNSTITRGMFVTALGKLANVNKSLYTKSSFSDVSNTADYMPYVEWASKNNILKGVSNGKFAPDAAMTREQMAAAIRSYANVIGYPLPKVYTEVVFADSAKISSFAKESVKAVQRAGILYPKTGNRFDPQGTVTKAEASVVLRRFIELTINTDTAKGWVRNDSGKWMYYKDGKALTGTQVINGVSYNFNKDGERI